MRQSLREVFSVFTVAVEEINIEHKLNKTRSIGTRKFVQ